MGTLTYAMGTLSYTGTLTYAMGTLSYTGTLTYAMGTHSYTTGFFFCIGNSLSHACLWSQCVVEWRRSLSNCLCKYTRVQPVCSSVVDTNVNGLPPALWFLPIWLFLSSVDVSASVLERVCGERPSCFLFSPLNPTPAGCFVCPPLAPMSLCFLYDASNILCCDAFCVFRQMSNNGRTTLVTVTKCWSPLSVHVCT